MAAWRLIGLDAGDFALLQNRQASARNIVNLDSSFHEAVHWEAIARCQQSDFTAGEDREGARAYRITFTTQGIAYYTVAWPLLCVRSIQFEKKEIVFWFGSRVAR